MTTPPPAFTESAPKILLFAHDPGGANTIIPLVQPLQEAGYIPMLYGKRFALEKYRQAELEGVTLEADTEEDLTIFLKEHQPHLLITGTSANDMTEKYLWQAARSLNIASMAVLDQWMNYGIRFSAHGMDTLQHYQENPQHPYLPDTLCVMDAFAKEEMTAAGLPKARIEITGQPYFQHLRQSVANLNREAIRARLGVTPEERLLVYVSEPIELCQGASTPLGYTEKTIFQALLNTLAQLDNQLTSPVCLLIKGHPKESREAYQEYINENTLKHIRIQLDDGTTPWEVVAASDHLIGMSSMLLIEAAICDKPITSIQIGLSQPNPLVLCRQGILQPILDESTLLEHLNTVLNGGKSESIDFPIIENPVERILALIQTKVSRSLTAT
ncbi:MAG: alpha-2,8-polysialyltransferase family protein [Vampirovibrio sp.]|nr:alpha-2,8-polysialyltransferase family protein [Vampirovibrio sp.]